jgi:hypothetical protein
MKLLKIVIVPALVLMLGLSALPQTAFAHDGEVHDDTTANASSIREKALERITELQAKREAARQEREASIEDVKSEIKERFKQACEARKASFQTRLENLVERSDTHLSVLDKILERVKSFKTSKALSVANYDQLVASAEAKKEVVRDLQSAASQKAAEDFACDRTTALEGVQTFKDILKQQIESMKEYKTAVKDLIVAVKTAAKAARSESNAN